MSASTAVDHWDEVRELTAELLAESGVQLSLTGYTIAGEQRWDAIVTGGPAPGDGDAIQGGGWGHAAPNAAVKAAIMEYRSRQAGAQ